MKISREKKNIDLNYNHSKLEQKIQKDWNSNQIYKTEQDSKKKPYYVLDMFPYPSGQGLHVGHPRGYIGSDVFARFKRMQGYNVLHPMGFDAFGLPAEQYAIQTGKHPSIITKTAIKRYKKQLEGIGFSYDWTREIQTIDPDYYKWTQVIFLKIYNSFYDTKKRKARPIDDLVKIFEKEGNVKGNEYTAHSEVKTFSKTDWKNFSPKEKQDILMKYRLAYEGYAEVNWCKELGTVLANDEVLEKDGKLVSERGDFPVEKRSMRQWFMRISAYGDRLLSGLDLVDFPESTKEIQRNWIGKSEGSEIEFPVVSSHAGTRDPENTTWIPDHTPGYNLLHNNSPEVRHDNTLKSIKIFTTRADTLFGVTYVVLAPEHVLVNELLTQCENRKDIEKYIETIKNKTQEERTDSKEKTGIELKGITAINPANGEAVPVWIADYVLASYGTGAVMAVPAHDERDFEFAKKYNLPIRYVVEPLFVQKTGDSKVNDEVHFEPMREVVSVAVRDAKTNKFLTISWKGVEMKGFITGGVEGDDSIEVAARKEILEETGYKNLKLNYIFPFNIHTKFYHRKKYVNRHARWNFVYFDLIDDEKEEISDKENDLHDVVWIDENKINNYISFEESICLLSSINNKFSFLTNGGILSNSSQFTGLTSDQAKKEITKFVGGRLVTKYKMRDAIFARQRYWGEPIPLIHDKKTGLIKEVPLSKLPLKLPNVKSYKPSGTGESPLAGVKSWADAGYETNTMPGWAASSWYFLRYMDPKNKKSLVGDNAIKYWKNVDMYVGGTEHNTGHLLYARFWNKILFDLGLIKTDEPFQALRHQGMIGGADGRKMSKRWGNVVNPDDVVKTYGADTLRVFEMFLGPFDAHLPWSEDGIIGSRRFVERVWRVSHKVEHSHAKHSDAEYALFQKVLHKTIKKVTEDIESFNHNTAVSAMMICLNEMEKQNTVSVVDFKLFLQILAPFASHIADELWHTFDEKKSIHLSSWPKYNPKLIIDTEVTLGVQVNGKVRGEVTLAIDANQKTVESLIFQNENVQKYITGPIKKFIYIPGKIISIVV